MSGVHDNEGSYHHMPIAGSEVLFYKVQALRMLSSGINSKQKIWVLWRPPGLRAGLCGDHLAKCRHLQRLLDLSPSFLLLFFQLPTDTFHVFSLPAILALIMVNLPWRHRSDEI